MFMDGSGRRDAGRDTQVRRTRPVVKMIGVTVSIGIFACGVSRNEVHRHRRYVGHSVLLRMRIAGSRHVYRVYRLGDNRGDPRRESITPFWRFS